MLESRAKPTMKLQNLCFCVSWPRAPPTPTTTGHPLVYIYMNRLQRLQLVQNSAARVISQTKRYTSITPILNEIHWLPINKRCQFKILLLTFKSLNGCAPEYLCDMLNVYMPNRSLRSTAFTSLVPYINRSIRLGRRLFETYAAKLWNELPRNIQRAESITMFKKLI